MSTFTPEELTLICLYDPGTRLGAVEELRNMMQYLMYDETELKGLTLRVIAKLEAMSDAGYKRLSAEIIPDFPQSSADRRQSHGHKGTGLCEAG